ncbi:hypothetical protein GGE45_001708 [Rhizobium aethiopicum]|uniref:Uncharacterized protein n=1 Tax=Rhizobium aethiopicum TaxID=1138170 RepID=A0A7W6MJ80_9HYPH|nr:hypothetical protein [Rhizobium aethiopicum]MBB4579384.1 hypothetical protein [Rhizobium aethiopicum]
MSIRLRSGGVFLSGEDLIWQLGSLCSRFWR